MGAVRGPFVALLGSLVLVGLLPGTASAARDCEGQDALTYDLRIRGFTQYRLSETDNQLPDVNWESSFEWDFEWDGIRLKQQCHKRFASIQVVTRGDKDETLGDVHFTLRDTRTDSDGDQDACEWEDDFSSPVTVDMIAFRRGNEWAFVQNAGIVDERLLQDTFAGAVGEIHDNSCPNRALIHFSGINDDYLYKGLEVTGPWGWPWPYLGLQDEGRGDPPSSVQKLLDGKSATVSDSPQFIQQVGIEEQIDSVFWEVSYRRRGRGGN